MGKDTVRDELLNAAGEIFAEKGFKPATVREICQRAGANLAAVNYYFGDKERLYIEAVKHARRLRERQQPLPAWSIDTPPAEKLRIFVTTLVRRIVGTDGAPWQLRLLIREIMEPTKACEELVQEAFRPDFQLLLSILNDLTGNTLPPHRLQQLGFSLIGQIVYYRVHDKIVGMLVDQDQLDKHYQPDQLADHISDVILAAVSAGAGLFAEEKAATNVRESA
ncbi:MAG: CerR family C-terminal domain-containing protein [Planctomycetota bacterium]|nr:CerR family C-terminal domain-containing protein [Planctomycetota bacterium]